MVPLLFGGLKETEALYMYVTLNAKMCLMVEHSRHVVTKFRFKQS